MKLWLKITISGIFISILIPIVGIAVFFYTTNDMCGNYPHAEYLSPNKEYKAVVFQRDCGATTGFSTQISIIEAGSTLQNKSGNIHIVGGHPDKVAPQLIWRSNSELHINRPLSGNEFHAATKWGVFNQIKVTYGAGNS